MVAAEGQACSVASTSQFAEALQNTHCDVVLIAGAGLTLLKSDFDQASTVDCTTCAGGVESGKVFVREGRSVVVRGERPNAGTMLDPAWLKRRILLGANVTFQASGLRMKGCVCALGACILVGGEGAWTVALLLHPSTGPAHTTVT